jgi:hypothetical protein
MTDLAREITVVEHHHPDSRGHMPPREALRDPAGLTEREWVPVDDFPRSGSAPLEAPLLVEGTGQTAVFRREDSLLVVAAYAPPVDTLLRKKRPPPEETSANGEGEPGISLPPPWEFRPASATPDTLAGLFLMPVDSDDELLGVEARGGSGVLAVTAPPGSYMLSLELWNPAGRWSARLRHGLRAPIVPPDVPSLSDFLMLGPRDALPSNLDEALPRAIPGTLLRSGGGVTLAWEVYGLGRRREPLGFGVTLVRDEGGFLRRALDRVGLFRRSPALSLSWSEGGSDAPGPLFRAVDVALPELEPGWYVLRLELAIPNRGPVQSVRRVLVY